MGKNTFRFSKYFSKVFHFQYIIILKKQQILDEPQRQAFIPFLDFYSARNNFQYPGIQYNKPVVFITLLLFKTLG